MEHQSTQQHKSTYTPKKLVPLVETINDHIKWNFKSLDYNGCIIDALIVLNNSKFNLNWLKSICDQTASIFLADGGANIYYTLHKSQPELSIEKVKAVVGDLDSLLPEIQEFYRSKGVQIVKDFDQETNDFQKTLRYCISKGCKNIVISGAFGERLDHNYGTISITEKMTKIYPEINLVISSESSLQFPLRTGLRHQITVPKHINVIGCGLISFQKVSGIETSGFKWNLGGENPKDEIEWGNFLSTSNEINRDIVTIQAKKQQGLIHFVANFKSQLI